MAMYFTLYKYSDVHGGQLCINNSVKNREDAIASAISLAKKDQISIKKINLKTTIVVDYNAVFVTDMKNRVWAYYWISCPVKKYIYDWYEPIKLRAPYRLVY